MCQCLAQIKTHPQYPLIIKGNHWLTVFFRGIRTWGVSDLVAMDRNLTIVPSFP